MLNGILTFKLCDQQNHELGKNKIKPPKSKFINLKVHTLNKYKSQNSNTKL